MNVIEAGKKIRVEVIKHVEIINQSLKSQI